MKSKNGITMISLTIYIIVMVIVVSVVSVLTSYFYKNVNTDTQITDQSRQYTRFNSYFTRDINKTGTSVVECAEDNKSIVFLDNEGTITQYTFIEENKGIYYNTIKIASNIESCQFAYEQGENKITVTIGGNSTEYYLKR